MREVPWSLPTTDGAAMQLGDHEVIRLINYIRGQVQNGHDPRQDLQQSFTGARPWQHDRFLQTVLEDDALLMYDFQEAAAQHLPQ